MFCCHYVSIVSRKGIVMKSKESFAQHLTRETVQAIVRQERFGWPPASDWGAYQPHRPDKPLPKPQDKK